ncbi:hypothetical protein BURMUCF2_0991 [Burkholderia multivorans CF2]|nr:hypothetical protein BURMUCF2_0991 [Burkholderia multivorans CF2]
MPAATCGAIATQKNVDARVSPLRHRRLRRTPQPHQSTSSPDGS